MHIRLPRTRIFQHRGWHSGVGQLVGFASAVVALQTFAIGYSPLWLIPSLIVYFTIGLSIRAGFHGLFAHQHYPTSRFWQLYLLIVGTFACSGSSLQWAIAHAQHHRYSDGPGDPHNVRGWWSFLLFWYHHPKYTFGHAKHLINDPVHRLFHRYFWALPGLTAIGLAICGWQYLLFFFTLPIGCLLIMGGVHNVVAHAGREPRNVWWYAPFSFGEWRHKDHHDHPGNYRFGRWDLGADFIDCIRSDKP